MANYNCAIRTNYFHVNDLDAFMNLMDQVVGSEGEVELLKETDRNGDPIFAFGCYGGIAGIPDDVDNEFDDDSQPAGYLPVGFFSAKLHKLEKQ